MARREYPGVYPYPAAGGRTVVRNFAAEMVELVKAGELAPKTVNNTLSCLSTCLKDAVALHKIPSNPSEHIAHLPGSHIERDWLRRARSRSTWRRARSSTGRSPSC